jgi:stage II sporulation protein AA (anti-sigma F factor antagonist)
MAIHTKRDGNTAVVSVSGRLDAVTAPDYATAAKELIEGGTTRLVVDCQELTYISSAGLSELFMAAKMLKAKDGHFGVANVRGNVRTVIEMCGVGKLLGIHASVPEALAAFV